MKNIFKLIRLQNLLIIALTQVLIRYFVIQPFLIYNGYNLAISTSDFILFVLSTVLIAASGYIINDYYDIKTDYINQPHKVIINKKVSKKTTFTLYYIFIITGFLLGSYAALYNLMPELILMFLIIIGLLYFYSYTYSKQLITGNLVIAVLTAMVPVIIGFSEIKAVLLVYSNRVIHNINIINELAYWVIGYALFAFVLTLIREIIKDAEDFEGDMIDNRNTIPIIFGINTTKIIIYALNFLVTAILITAYVLYIEKSFFNLVYIILTIIAPVIYATSYIIKANESNNYKLAGDIYKFIMIAGISFSIFNRVY